MNTYRLTASHYVSRTGATVRDDGYTPQPFAEAAGYPNALTARYDSEQTAQRIADAIRATPDADGVSLVCEVTAG